MKKTTLSQVKTNKYLYWLRSKCKLVTEFFKQTTHSEYLAWNTRHDKLLIIVFIEWLLDYVGKHLFIGLLLTLALTTSGWLGLYLKLTIGYWLLFKVLVVLRQGE